MINIRVAIVFAGIAGLTALIGITVNRIQAFGKQRYQTGIADCQRDVQQKAQDIRETIESIKSEADKDKTDIDQRYIDGLKDIAAGDATLKAENLALKDQLQRLRREISNGPIDQNKCASITIPANSLQLHNEIDRLLHAD